MTPSSRLLASVVVAVITFAPALTAQWTAPTPEELSMTSIPEVPGARAVFLYKEETGDDALHMQSFYVRLKVLTEGGKEYANVELPFASGAAGITLDTVSGRTIHSDGTIVPFTAKPYEKLVQKMQDYKIKVLVFSLPSVEIGSIIEYRYKLHTDDHYFHHPDWIVQTDLFTRKAHYMWRPTDRLLTSEDGKQTSSSVAWTPILPAGTTVQQHELPVRLGADGGHTEINLDVHDIPPVPKEDFMPPMQSLSYRVMFYYTPYRTAKEFWTAEGKRWSKESDKFIGPGSATRTKVNELVAAGDTPEQKLRKIYAFVMTLDNTDFSRTHTGSEERAQGLKEIRSADDVLTRSRGSADQIAALFVGMARAAGMKAYLMSVANRRQRLFLASYLSMSQVEDNIAIVNVDGKEMYFDPGERYCSFGHLSWEHALTGGLRQIEAGTAVDGTPTLTYKDAHISRIADLKLDDQGIASGVVKMEYAGESALAWRQEALRGDETGLSNDLRSHMEHLMPGGMEIKVTKIENLKEYELPLRVEYQVKGGVGSSTGKRLLVPSNLFEANSKPRFPEAKRDLPIDMHYPSAVQDVVRFTLPGTLVVESAPAAADAKIAGIAAFGMSTKSTPNSITLSRNVTMGATLLPATAYADLRGFYSKLEAKDQEVVVLTRPGAAAAATSPAGN